MRIFGVLILGLFLLTLAPSCATVPGKARGYKAGYREVGVASWYGPGFHGRRTSNGEVYDMHGFTAAHRTMPFGTVLHVKNRDNGRSVQVRVNDRGPFIRGRVLDLSFGAAKALDMVGPGIAPVEIRIIRDGASYARVGREKRVEGFSVQVGAFLRRENALRLQRSLEKSYQPVYIVTAEVLDQQYFRVRVGKFRTEAQADRLAIKLTKLENLETFVVRED